MTEQQVNPLDIPQTVLNQYHRCYDNRTYRAFTHQLRSSFPVTHSAFADALANLCIDAALERCGAAYYRGHERSLMQLISHDDTLFALAQTHLANFTAPESAAMADPIAEVQQALNQTQTLTEAAARQVSLVHSWRGRAAYGWVNAASHLLHAAQIVLMDGHSDSYLLEKLDRSLDHLRNGVIEARQHHVGISVRFMAWMRQLVKART
ncbi:MAG: hypothetical protein IT324_06845 [Anaerolineae bacterium]|nr:hypothetical protein [Anaerolineae bacterium]